MTFALCAMVAVVSIHVYYFVHLGRPVSFYGCVLLSGLYLGLALMFIRTIGPIFFVLAIAYAWFAWNDRHNRRRKNIAHKLGYKARAIRARLVANMPKMRPGPGWSPA